MADPELTAAPAHRRWLRLLVGLSISAALLAWVVARLDAQQLYRSIVEVQLPWLVAAVGCKALAIVIKGQRWSVVLRTSTGSAVRRVVSATWLGYTGNAVFPFRLGELIRIQVIRNHARIPFSQGVATLVVERSLDGAVVLTMLAAASTLVVLPEWAARGVIVFAAFLLCLVALVVALALRPVAVPERWLRGRSVRWAGTKLNFILGAFARGLSVVRSPRLLLLCLGISVLAWTAEVAGTLLLFRAFGMPLAWAVAMLLTSTVSLGLTAPSAPSGVGAHQFLYVVLLAPFGVSANDATACSLAITVCMLTVLVAVGVPLLVREGLSLRALWRSPGDAAES